MVRDTHRQDLIKPVKRRRRAVKCLFPQTYTALSEFAAPSTSKEMSQSPRGQSVSSNLSSEICSSLHPSTLPSSPASAAQPLSPVAFLSLSISGSGAVKKRLRSLILLCLPPKLPSIRPSFWMCQAHKVRPKPLTFCVSEKRKARVLVRGRHSS